MICWAVTECEHGISCNEACDPCDYDEYLESLAAMEDAESLCIEKERKQK